MSGTVCKLTDRTIIAVSGDEARSFLQRLVTNDVETLAAGEARYAALLTPQGKIITDFFVVAVGNDLMIDAPAATAADLVRRLTLYRLRAKVGIADVSDRFGMVAFAPGATPAGSVASFADPRDTGLWHRAIVARGGTADADDPLREDASGEDAYRRQRIAAGVPESGLDFAFGETFPHDANLDRLNGVDFRKGCYVGQEVVSRVQHRGTARKRIVAFDLDGAPPAVGSDIMLGDMAIGTTGGGVDGRVLGLVRLDRLAEADGGPVTAQGIPLRHAPG